MFLDKKADAKTVRNLLLLLIVAIILISFTIKFGTFLYDAGNRKACYNWAVLQGMEFIGKTPVIGTIGSEIPSPCITTSEVIKTNKREEIYEQLAQNMYLCWDQYGEGKIDFYSNWNFDAYHNYCRICSEIKLDKNVKERTINLDDFEKYLSENYPPNHEETYAEYFLGTENARIDFGKGEIPLTFEEDLYTLFVVEKSEKRSFEEGSVIAVGGCAGGALLGAKIGGFLSFISFGALSPSIPTFATVGCAMGVVGSGVAYYAHEDVIYPSLLLVSGRKTIDKTCADIYEKPQKPILNFNKEGSEK